MRTGRFGELVPCRGFSRHQREVASGGSVWVSHDGLVVVSACENAPLPGTDPPVIGQQWHISVSRSPHRSLAEDVQRVIDGFEMPAYDEDNHHPGIARHLWCPLDERYRSACECKLTETLIVEPDGYEWTNDETEPCRGCKLERLTGRPCTIHASAS